jgi:hypothetical protein
MRPLDNGIVSSGHANAASTAENHMKHTIALSLFLVSIAASGCIAPADESAAEAPVGEVSQDLSKIDFMGALPWSAQAGWTTDSGIFHEVDWVHNKYVNVDTYGNFPQFTGAFTWAKFNNCVASSLRTIIYQRHGSSDPWSSISDQTVMASPTVSNDAQGNLIISKCDVSYNFGGCGFHAHYFDNNTDQMNVHLYAWGGDGSVGQKMDVVQRSDPGEFCSP